MPIYSDIYGFCDIIIKPTVCLGSGYISTAIIGLVISSVWELRQRPPNMAIGDVLWTNECPYWGAYVFGFMET